MYDGSVLRWRLGATNWLCTASCLSRVTQRQPIYAGGNIGGGSCCGSRSKAADHPSILGDFKFAILRRAEERGSNFKMTILAAADASTRSAPHIDYDTSRVIGRRSPFLPLLLVRSGQTIFCEGDVGADVFQLFSGTVRFSSISSDGQRLIAGFAVADELFSLSHNNRHVFSAEAVSDCSVSRIRRTALGDFPSGVLGERIESASCERTLAPTI